MGPNPGKIIEWAYFPDEIVVVISVAVVSERRRRVRAYRKVEKSTINYL
jgi:hypothetical protein